MLENVVANHSLTAGKVSAKTWTRMPIEATSLMPVPTMNERNDPKPAVVDQFADDGSEERPEDNPDGRQEEEPDEYPDGGAD